MKKTIVNLKVMAASIGILLVFSCSAEDGEDGAIGPQGPQGEQGIQGPAGQNGIDGQDGTDGQDGSDGQDGEDGQDGADGEDGNANVRSIIYNVTDASGDSHGVDMQSATTDIIENGAILAYLFSSNVWQQIPNTRVFTNSSAIIDINTFINRPGNIYRFVMEFSQSGSLFNISENDLTTLRLVLIEATSTTTGKSSKETVLQELKEADVDVSDYYEIMDYFGLEH